MKTKIYTCVLMVFAIMLFYGFSFATPTSIVVLNPVADCDDPTTFAVDHDYDDATPVALWTTTASRTITAGGCHVYEVDVTAGKMYTFKTGCAVGDPDFATADFDTFLEVYNSAGAWITENDDGCSSYRSTVSWVAASTGHAYVKVRGYNSSSYGSYRLACIEQDGPAVTCKTPTDSDTEIDISVLATDTWATNPAGAVVIPLVSNGCHVFKFKGILTGRTYTFKTGCGDGATADFDTWIELYDADGNSLVSNDDGCAVPASGNYSSKIEWTATYGSGDPLAAADAAYVKVRGYNSSKYGDFRMAYKWGAATPSTCKSIPTTDPNTTLDVGALVQGTWVTSPTPSPAVYTITSDGCHVFKVTKITSGRLYTFKTGCGDGATASFDTWIELYDENGASLLSNDDGCSNYTSTITWTATYGTGLVDDFIFVKVRGYNSSKFGTFRMAYAWVTAPTVTCQPIPTASPDAELDLDNDGVVGADVGLAEDTWATTASMAIASDACKVFKVLDIVLGKAYTFKTGCATTGGVGTDEATANFDTWIELYDAAGTSLASNDDGCSGYTSTLTWTATYSGYAFVKVRGYNSTKTGSFRMAYSFGDPAAPPAAICKTPPLFDGVAIVPTAGAADTWVTTAEQTVAVDACYVFKVTTVVGNEYTFKTGCAEGAPDLATASFDTFMELYNSAGTWLKSDDDGCESYRSKLVWTATGTTYYVKVRGYNSSNYGPYKVAYKFTLPAHCIIPGVGVPDETLLDPGAPATWVLSAADGELENPNECHVIQVPVVTDNVYTFKTGCGNSATASFDTFLELYNASGVWLAENDDGCAVPASGDYTSKIEWTATYTGNALVKVRGYNSSNYGTFRMAYSYAAKGPDVVTLGTGNDLARNQIKVYPNPADQSFTVVSKAPVTFTRLTVSEFTGRLVKSWNLQQPATSLQIESTDFAPGVYILSIETSEGWIRQKVSIVR